MFRIEFVEQFLEFVLVNQSDREKSVQLDNRLGSVIGSRAFNFPRQLPEFACVVCVQQCELPSVASKNKRRISEGQAAADL